MTRCAAVALGLALTVACGTDAGVSEDAGGPAPVAPAPDPAVAQIGAVLTSYYQALSDLDWPVYAAHFWPDATLTTVWTPAGADRPELFVATVPDFVARAPLGPGSRSIFEEHMLSSDITVQAGLAQAWVRYTARFGDPGDVAEWEGVDAFTLLRHDGEWRITSLAYVADD